VAVSQRRSSVRVRRRTSGADPITVRIDFRSNPEASIGSGLGCHQLGHRQTSVYFRTWRKPQTLVMPCPGCLDQKDLTLVVGQSEVVAVSGTRAVVGGLENIVGACLVGDDGCAGATSLDGLVDVRSRNVRLRCECNFNRRGSLRRTPLRDRKSTSHLTFENKVIQVLCKPYPCRNLGYVRYPTIERGS
jgi:hypothetical protein